MALWRSLRDFQWVLIVVAQLDQWAVAAARPGHKNLSFMVPFKFRTGRHRVEQLYFSEAKWVLGKCCIDFIFPPALRIFWWHPVKGADFMSVWSWLWNHSLFYTYIIEAYNDLMSGVKKYQVPNWVTQSKTNFCIHPVFMSNSLWDYSG